MSWQRLSEIACAISMVVFALTFGVARLSDRTVGHTGLIEPPRDEALIQKGAYLAKAADCAACHSVKGRPDYAGGLAMALPVGVLYTPNITPDRDHGIGAWSIGDFDRAMRFGIARDHAGRSAHTMYPAMPFVSYASMPSGDIQALWAYFKYRVTPQPVPTRQADITWPLSLRFPLTFWRWAFAPPPAPYAAPMIADAAVARGAYLVDGPGHCGECHTPRGIGMQLKALRNDDDRSYLAGAKVEAWYAPSLRSEGPGSLEEWKDTDIAEFLKTGSNRFGMAFGSMTEVIEHSTHAMSDEDLQAIGRYLKTVGTPTGDTHRYDNATAQALADGHAVERGALTYINNCAACHRPDGKGYAGVFPPLAGNPAVETAEPLSLITVILHGSTSAKTPRTPAKFTMPPFNWRLSDKEVADVASFIRTGWGNRGAPVSVKSVARTRKLAEKLQVSAARSGSTR